MYTFPKLIKKIREEANLTQAEFAGILDVSAVLIAMVETEQKEVSKKLVLKLADKMEVHPSSITPFLFIDKENIPSSISDVEHKFIEWGEKMQAFLIKNKAKKLNKYAR